MFWQFNRILDDVTNKAIFSIIFWFGIASVCVVEQKCSSFYMHMMKIDCSEHMVFVHSFLQFIIAINTNGLFRKFQLFIHVNR